MDIRVTMSARQELRQEMRLAQVIEYAKLMAIPDEVLSVVAGAVAFNPDSIEGLLEGRKKDTIGGAGKVQTIYTSLTSGSTSVPEGGKRGLIISPDIRTLEEHVGSYQVETTPDVTYVGRKNAKPEIILSDHLKGAMGMLVLQIDPVKYPNASKLLRQLRNFDTWKRSQLREAYLIMGDKQREFFESFDNTRLHLFLQRHVAERLDLTVGTISRILSNRWIEARDVAGNQRVMYAKDLFATEEDLLRYRMLPVLNEIFAEEFEKGRVYSDREITERVRGIARRTITKYRKEAGIPSTPERRRLYSCRSRDEPFVII